MPAEMSLQSRMKVWARPVKIEGLSASIKVSSQGEDVDKAEWRRISGTVLRYESVGRRREPAVCDVRVDVHAEYYQTSAFENSGGELHSKHGESSLIYMMREPQDTDTMVQVQYE